MTATAHSLVAGALATRFPAPQAALLAFVSHYVLDSIPHWDFGTNWRSRPKKATGVLAVFETLVGICIAYYFFSGVVAWPTLLGVIVVSLLPDWLETPWYIFYAQAKKHEPVQHASLGERLAYRAYKIQNVFHTKAQLPLGLLTQIGSVAFFLFLLK